MSKELQTRILGFEPEFISMSVSEQAQKKFKVEAGYALQALQANQYLQQICFENPESLKNAILNIASTGLSLDPIRQQAYLVPLDRKVVLQISYRGLVDLVRESGFVKAIKINAVHEKDEFKSTGSFSEPIHIFSPFSKQRGDLIGLCCIIKDENDNFHTETMMIEEIKAIRDRTQGYKSFKNGKAKSSIWETDFMEMAKKTILKRAVKLMPKKKAVDSAISYLNDDGGEGYEEEKQIEKTVEEKKEAKLIASSEVEKKTAERNLAIEEIKKSMSVLTEGMTLAQKGAEMKRLLSVTVFSDVMKWSNEELFSCCSFLMDEINKKKNVITTNEIKWED